MPNVALHPDRATVISGLEGGYDVFDSTTHKLRTRTGTSPLESGAEITDHAVASPVLLTLTGIVSDLTINGDARAREAWEIILQAWKSVTLFQVTTAWTIYPQMILIDVDARELGFGIEFTLKLEEVQIVGREEAVPSFEALAPAAERQPVAVIGTVANVSTPNVQAAKEALMQAEELKKSRNPLDWLRDVNQKVNNVIGSVANHDLIRGLRQINETFSSGILGRVIEIEQLDRILNGIDLTSANTPFEIKRLETIRRQSDRAVDFLTSGVNDLNSRRNKMLIGYVDNNRDIERVGGIA